MSSHFWRWESTVGTLFVASNLYLLQTFLDLPGVGGNYDKPCFAVTFGLMKELLAVMEKVQKHTPKIPPSESSGLLSNMI